MKKYFYLLAILAVSFVACSDESANKGDSVIVNGPMEVERLVMNISKSFTSYTRGNSGEFVYPDYYGGMYTNDSGYPVVLIKGNMAKGKEDMIRRAGSDKFEVESCDYSFNELSELNSELSDILCEGNFPDELTWNGVGILVDKNRVSVDLEVCSEENIQLFKRLISNSPAIVFGYGTSIIIDSPVDSDNVNREESNVRSSVLMNPGGKFSSYGVSNNNMYSGSIGVRGTRGGKSGFVTASHCIPKLTISGGSTGSYRPVYRDGSYCGDCVLSLYSSGLDLAFVELFDEYEATRVTEWSKVSLTKDIVSVSSLSALNVTMNGISTNNGYRPGKVLAVEQTKTVENRNTPVGVLRFTAKHLVFAQYPSQNGDSGGVVYTPSGNIAGIHCGSGTTSGYGEHAFFTYATYIVSSLGVTLY